MNIILGVLIPLIGTTLGSACVFFLKGEIGNKLQKVLLGFAAGVMVAASVWSLLIPAMDMSADMGKLSFLPALIGFLLGMGFLLIMDSVIPHMHVGSDEPEGTKSKLQKTTMLLLAVAIHNFPEGIATFIGALNDPQMGGGITFAIAIHNIPEGIAVAIPIYYATKNKGKALLLATLSGMSELVGALLCLAVTSIFGVELTDGGPAFPLILAAVAGIMIYISLDELLPTAEKYGKHHIAIAGVVAGMAIMGVSLLIL